MFLQELRASQVWLLSMSPPLKDAGDGGWARGAYAPLRLGHSGALTEEGGRPGRRRQEHAERLSRGTEVGSPGEPKAGAGGERGANRGWDLAPRLTPTRCSSGRSGDCQPGCSEKGSGTGTRTFRNGVENDLEHSRDPRGGGDTGRPRCAAPSPAVPTLSSAPAFAYLKRPPGSPPLPVGPRRRPPTRDQPRGSRKPAPQPPACPTSAASPPARGASPQLAAGGSGNSRRRSERGSREPSGAEPSPGPEGTARLRRGAARALASGSWRRGRAGGDGGGITTCF